MKLSNRTIKYGGKHSNVHSVISGNYDADVNAHKNLLDLHTHSTCSDGSLSPEDLVHLAIETGLQAMSLTDHDSMDGIERAMKAAINYTAQAKSAHPHLSPPSFYLIPGIEICTLYKQELHILGYFRQDNYHNLSAFIEKARRERIERNARIIKKLNMLGIPITEAEVSDEAGKEVFGRPHIATVLYKKGYCSDMNNAFTHYLAYGKKAYVHRVMPSPQECISHIASAGGLPVIAHPVHLKMKLKGMKMLIAHLLKFGLWGIEAYYTDNTAQDTQKFLALANEFGLTATGGSDFHGSYKRSVRLGVGKGNLRIPDQLLDTMLTALDHR